MKERKNEKTSDKNSKIWFKRKTYGWGWAPAAWQGWTVLFAYIGLVLMLVTAGPTRASMSAKELLFGFLLPLAFLSFGLIFICYVRGEKPKWQWGTDKDSKN